MTTDVRPSFLGIEIHGDISYGDKRKDQRPIEAFQAIVRAVLDDPTVAEFGWRQYTPYFNDGDPCVFGAHGAWVRLTTDAKTAPEEGDEDDEDDDEYEDTEQFEIQYGSSERIGEREFDWVGDYPNRTRVPGAYTGPDEARYDRLIALADAIEDGEFDDVLLGTFGDHAEVKVRRSGIQVDSYEHD